MATGTIKGLKEIINRSVHYVRSSTSAVNANATYYLSLQSGQSSSIPSGYKLCGIGRIYLDSTNYNQSTISNKINCNQTTTLNTFTVSTEATSLPSTFAVKSTSSYTGTTQTKFMEIVVEYIFVPEELVP